MKRGNQARFSPSLETQDTEEDRISAMRRGSNGIVGPSLRPRLHLSEETHGKPLHQYLAPSKREYSNSKEIATGQGKETWTWAKQAFPGDENETSKLAHTMNTWLLLAEVLMSIRCD